MSTRIRLNNPDGSPNHPAMKDIMDIRPDHHGSVIHLRVAGAAHSSKQQVQQNLSDIIRLMRMKGDEISMMAERLAVRIGEP